MGAAHQLCHGGLVYLLIVKYTEPPVINYCHEDQYRTIRRQTHIPEDDLAVLPKDTSRPSPFAKEIRNIVNSKLLVGDVTDAVRIIASDDSVITPTSEVVTALRLKHQPSPLNLRPPPTKSLCQTSSVSEEEVIVAMKSFRPISAGGGCCC